MLCLYSFTVRKVNKQWGFVGAVWFDRIILAYILLAASYQGLTWLVWIAGICLAINLIMYNPWAMPVAADIAKKLIEKDENKSE